uniref:type V CRISPR-associated protein Cas12k n=1 Tax=Trichocoleus desertorum TaxID=1481672 RepID=UPI0025B5DCAF|nr:type V CRISPR-associated protein Cas12k [Trichocoleus desertorum]
MSQITIQCRLIVNEPTRQQLWTLMAELNTPLINELLLRVNQHAEFETWQQKGKLPAGTVKQMCQVLRSDPRFTGQPARFYMSAIAIVDYIYKAWFAIQKRLQRQLDGKVRWFEMLKSDAELLESCGCNLETLRTKARELLAHTSEQPGLTDSLEPKSKRSKKRSGKAQTKPTNTQDEKPNLANALFEAYRETEDTLQRAFICYLLKNGCKVRDREKDPEKFAKKRRKLAIQIERLTKQLAGRRPQGRELTDEVWMETLEVASTKDPEDETEARSWQDALLRKSSVLPFPVTYETNEDLTWFKNDKGRICVKFNGLSEHTFQIYCDRRHLHWFQRFLEDQQLKRSHKNQHSSSLFTLRSGRIAWQEGKEQAPPWNTHHLTLYCTVDTRLWTAEGTQKVRTEKATEIAQQMSKTKEKGGLNEQQQAFLKRRQSTLARINSDFPRPSRPLYQSQPHVLVGVSMGLERPATIAVVDALTNKALAYRSTRQLLGDDYKLLNRQRQQQHQNAHKRQSAQRQGAPIRFSESELGQYIDRLLAKAIVGLAETYRARSIVLPKLENLREAIQSEIQAKAEQKCPELIEAQKAYAKEYRSKVHRWSYARLIANIQIQAAQVGILIEEEKQSIRGSPPEQAKELAIAAYHSRLSHKN